MALPGWLQEGASLGVPTRLAPEAGVLPGWPDARPAVNSG
jgi:hypothetical protein